MFGNVLQRFDLRVRWGVVKPVHKLISFLALINMKHHVIENVLFQCVSEFTRSRILFHCIDFVTSFVVLFEVYSSLRILCFCWWRSVARSIYMIFRIPSFSIVTVVGDTSTTLNVLMLVDNNQLYNSVYRRQAAEVVICRQVRYTFCPVVIDRGALPTIL